MQGFDVQFDASENMLKALNDKAKAQGISPNVWHGFVEQISLDNTYGLIFIPSSSFGLLIDEEVALNSLKTFYSILDNDGVLVFEAETLKAVPEQFGVPRSSAYKRDDDNMIIATFFDLPPEGNIGTVICRYELVRNNQIAKTEVEEFKVRMHDPENLRGKLKDIGFSSVNLRKAFDHKMSPGENDEVVVYECRK